MLQTPSVNRQDKKNICDLPKLSGCGGGGGGLHQTCTLAHTRPMLESATRYNAGAHEPRRMKFGESVLEFSIAASERSEFGARGV